MRGRNMAKCDVILPIYNAPEYVALCVYALFKNTNDETLGKIYLINDKSDEFTENLLLNLKKKYGDKIVLVNNKTNLGFVKSVYKGLKLTNSEYVLLINSDCFIADRTIEKLIKHVEKNNMIGLICPLSNNAANLSLNMFPGYSYTKMDKLLEENFDGMSFDACTIVGNCLMITQKCIQETGYLDETYGKGYAEESDYQFKAMKNGFEAKVAIDTYVFHESKKSFEESKASKNLRSENYKIFIERWKNEYYNLLDEYKKNDPINYINRNISKEDKKIEYDYLFVLLGISEVAGGVKVIVDIINYLCINGINIGMLNVHSGKYNEITVFDILDKSKINEINTKFVIGTIYSSMFIANKLAHKYNAETIYFSQGYEFGFNNGNDYGEVELSFKMADYVISISSFLEQEYIKLMNLESKLIVNGIATDLLIPNNKVKNDKKTITMFLRNHPLKGDFVLIDIIKKITTELSDLNLNIIMNNKNTVLGLNNNNSININKIYTPLTRVEIFKILKSSDIFIDTSFSEGFGLLPLETMASAAVPVIANSFGINEYAVDGENAIVIKEVNNTDKYICAIKSLITNESKLRLMQRNARETAKKFDFDIVIEKYIKFFNDLEDNKIQRINPAINKNELNLLSNFLISDKELDQMTKIVHKKVNKKKKLKRSTRFKILLKKYLKFTLNSCREFYHIIRNR